MMNQIQLYDIYGHWHQPFWQTIWFKCMCAFIIIALIGAIILWYYKYYYHVPEVSASLKALKGLEMLEKKPVQSKEDAQARYYALTAILKSFFENTYHIPFSAMSDREMIDALRTTQLPHQLMPALEKMIEASVQVKYAQHDVLQPELSHHLEMAKDIIQKII